jgi:hypothetical protein
VSARSGRRSTGRLALRLALVCGLAALIAGLLVVVSLAAGMERAAEVRRAWLLGGLVALVGAAAVAIVAYAAGSRIATRVTDLGLAIAKLGRGTTEVRVRVSGGDEVGALGRAVQYLATDLAALAQSAQQGGQAAGFDPLLRAWRDRALPVELPAIDGFELDAVVSKGSRGGLDYFDAAIGEGGRAALFLIGAEGQSTLAIVAARLARDELARAFQAGANARRALAHANKVMHRLLPGGICAKAAVLEFGGDEAKLYHAGWRAPLWVARAGGLEAITAEGIALGLDEGPVFEKSLRSTKIPLAQGVRLVQVNEAGGRIDNLADLVRAHAPKHTTPFMNLVAGTVETEAGPEGLREDLLLATVKRW